MRASRVAEGESDDLFEMASLSLTLTGLPRIVWISERGGLGTMPASRCLWCMTAVLIRVARHQFRCVRRGEVVAGPELDPPFMELVRQWIGINREAIIAH